MDGTSSLECWEEASLARIVDHLCEEHERWTATEFPLIEELLDRAGRLVVPVDPNLLPIAIGFTRLRDELAKHFDGEETVLFPAAVALERAAETRTLIERPAFGSVRNPATMLRQDHQQEVTMVADLRASCQGYRLDPAAPAPLQRLYEGLQKLEHTLQFHRELEDQILFPRVVELEASKRLYKPR